MSVVVDDSRDSLLTEFGKITLKNSYMLPGETYQKVFARCAETFGSDDEHAQRIYDYISRLWFMPATPVLANAGIDRGFPISCFLNRVDDSMKGIINSYVENSWLAARGGGIGTYWGDVREAGSRAGKNGKTSGLVPFIKVQDSLTLAISQGSIRPGSSAVYLPIHHPEIQEFIDVRKPTGGDPDRKTLNMHHAICLTDEFMEAVEKGTDFALRSVQTGEPVEKVKARDLWFRILENRISTGEPYLFFSDNVNKSKCETYQKLNLPVVQSNLCNEIALSTGKDHFGKERSAVCCLSSLNLEHFLEWKDHPTFIYDVMEFLDNVLSYFIEKASGHDGFDKAVYSASRERSVGLGVMGFHTFLQSLMTPIESAMAMTWASVTSKLIEEKADVASIRLGRERGPAPDCLEAGLEHRFANRTAIAPTASISIICGGVSPSIEPWPANIFNQKTKNGTVTVRNKALKALLVMRSMDTNKVWASITSNNGSIRHLPELADVHDVFKTAFEIDQRWLVDLAAKRQKHIDQSQSLNLFFTGDADKKDIHHTHMRAWKSGLKGLYYLRSTSIKRAKADFKVDAAPKDDECLSCQ